MQTQQELLYQNQLMLRRAVSEIGSACACPTIMAGGRATNRLERVWEWIGADGWCPDAEKAVHWVDRT